MNNAAIKSNFYYGHGTLSPWKEGVEMRPFPSLMNDISVDVCVVGGGIAGLTTAYLLMKEGKKVCVLELQEIGSGQTGQTTAQLCTALDTRYSELEKIYEDAELVQIAQSHKEAINLVEKIILDEKIDCDMARVPGYLFCSPDDEENFLSHELKIAHHVGLTEVHATARAPLESFDTGECLVFPNQLQIHPMKYLKGLTECLTRGGVRIYTHTHVTSVQSGPEVYIQSLDGYGVHAQSAVIATNTPINNLLTIHTKQAPYRTYVVGMKIPKGSVPLALFWDTEDPYHYIRVQPGSRYDLLIVGGEDHKTGQNDHPEQGFMNLIRWARHRFPMAQDVIYEWSGQVMESMDRLAFLGRNPMEKNVYIITGDSGNGTTHATIGAMIIRDQIAGRKNPWESLYDPSRKKVRSINTFIKENTNVAFQYTEWLANHPSLDKLSQLDKGEGIVITQGLRKIAVYRNEVGHFEYLSAACTHLGGVVHWNSVEKSWDCPCHGSRFDCHGSVIEGPAMQDLPPCVFNKPVDVVPLVRRLIPPPQTMSSASPF